MCHNNPAVPSSEGERKLVKALCVCPTDRVYHTPLSRFSMVDISTAAGMVRVQTESALESSRRELSEDVSFGIDWYTLMVVEQSSLENHAPGACDCCRVPGTR